MTVKISKPAINLREELASLRNQGGLPKEDKLYLDNLLPNGDFSNGLASWELRESPTSVTVTNGQVTIVPTQYRAIAQTLPVTVGKTYKISIEVVALNPNDANDRGRLYLGIINDTSLYLNDNALDIGVHTYYVKAVADTLVVRPATKIQTGQITFDNVSVQEVGENLVTNGTFDSDSQWNKGVGWTISGGTASSDGSQTSAYSELSQVLGVSVAVGDTFTVTYTVSNYGAGTMTSIFGNDAGTARTGNGTFTDVYTGVITTSTNFKMRANTNFIGNVDNIVITKGLHPVIQSIPHGYDVKDVYIDGELAREGEAYDYQVQTDGINQWLKPSVEPTATTETVVIGVRK